MDITGKIIAVLEPRTGKSRNTGNPWKVQTYVIETASDQYPRKCAFEVFGEDKIAQFNIKAGDELTVSFDIDAHEYQGRWYNSIRAWKVTPNTQAAQAPQAQAAPAADPFGSQPAASTTNDDTDDLPF